MRPWGNQYPTLFCGARFENRLVVVVEEMSSGQGDNPQADNEGADGENPVAGMAILGSEGGGFASAENLAAEADGHQQNAEEQSGPRHGLTFVPHPAWMREEAGERLKE